MAKKQAETLMKKLLNSAVTDETVKKQLLEAGFKESELTQKTKLVFDLFNLARGGNSKAVDTVLMLIGEKPAEAERQELPSEMTVDVEIINRE